MRAGFVISVCGHVVALLVGLLYAGANPFDSSPAEAITVDIMTPDQMAQATPEVPPQPETPTKTETKPPKTPPDSFGLSAAQAAPFNLMPPAGPRPPDHRAAPQTPKPPPAQTQAQASPQAQRPNPPRSTRQAAAAPPVQPLLPEPPSSPSPAVSAPDPAPHVFPNMFGMPVALPGGQLGGGFDAPAYDSANIGSDNQTAFRERLKTCSILPAGLSSEDKVRIVLRVSLNPDGTLASTPIVIEASASVKGPVLMESAINALRKCQPYSMLPADKYKEWQVIDLSFTPQDMTGG